MQEQVGYIEFELTESAKSALKSIVEKVVAPNEFYYSDIVSRIHGDVTNVAHLTLFFGLTGDFQANTNLKKFVDNIKINKLTLGRLNSLSGYQDLYKVLYIEVIDDGSLKKIAEEVKLFEHDAELGKRAFMPHITLAYVQKDYKIPSDSKLELSEIEVRNISLKP